jgi:hypothetical protein
VSQLLNGDVDIPRLTGVPNSINACEELAYLARRTVRLLRFANNAVCSLRMGIFLLRLAPLFTTWAGQEALRSSPHEIAHTERAEELSWEGVTSSCVCT